VVDILFLSRGLTLPTRGSFSEACEFLKLRIYESESVVQEGHGGDLVSDDLTAGGELISVG
jgi:hypothetical protein